MNNMITKQQNDAKYKGARSSLLLIVILSVVNIFCISFGDTYFLFSSYITQVIAAVGTALYIETGMAVYLAVAIALALFSVIPYAAFYIFSKDRPGCMVAALVLFSVDSLFFLLDFVLLLLEGDLSFLLDLIFRVYALVSLARAVKYGFAAKKQHPMLAIPMQDPAFDGADFEQYTAQATVQRKLALNRLKRFAGMAARIDCYLDGQKVGELKNGASLLLTMDGNAHELILRVPNGTIVGGTNIALGTENKSYAVAIKLGAMSADIILTEQPFAPAAE